MWTPRTGVAVAVLSLPESHRSLTTPMYALWLFLSIMVTCTCCFSFAQPFWFIRRDYTYTLGLFTYCSRETKTDYLFTSCTAYGGTGVTYSEIYDIYTSAWQAACILYGGGCALMGLSCIGAGWIFCVKSSFSDKLVLTSGYMQIAAVILLWTSLLVYPVGLGAPFVRHLCGLRATVYRSADCQMGWSYMLAIMGTALSLFCPIFAHYRNTSMADLAVSSGNVTPKKEQYVSTMSVVKDFPLPSLFDL